MFTQSEFENTIAELVDSSDAERNKTYERMREFASEQPDQFKQFLSEFPLNDHSALFEVYEALGNNGEIFDQLIISEVERLLNASSNSTTRNYPSLALGGFYTVTDSKTKRKIQNTILEYYDSEFINTRRSVISLIVGSNLFIDDNNKASSLLLNKVRELTADSDWRVRVLASEFLDQKVSIADTIRAKLFAPYSW